MLIEFKRNEERKDQCCVFMDLNLEKIVSGQKKDANACTNFVRKYIGNVEILCGGPDQEKQIQNLYYARPFFSRYLDEYIIKKLVTLLPTHTRTITH